MSGKPQVHMVTVTVTIQVLNFEGFKFSWISWFLAIHENEVNVQGIKISTDPRKYKPTNSLSFSYPRNFMPSKLNSLSIW